MHYITFYDILDYKNSIFVVKNLVMYPFNKLVPREKGVGGPFVPSPPLSSPLH